MRPIKTTLNTKWDLRSDGLHQSEFAQAPQKRDLRSGRLHQNKIAPIAQQCNLRSSQ